MKLPLILKSAWIDGHRLRLRDARPEDAPFILSLRTEPARNRFMSPVSTQVADQHAWLQRYAQGSGQAYFVIQPISGGDDLGTLRLYDAQGDSFSWGSWMLKPGAPLSAAVESALMAYHYALGLGFRAAHFDVLEGNAGVRRFHENFGAVQVGAHDGTAHYRIGYDAIRLSLDRYRRFLPAGIRVPGLS